MDSTHVAGQNFRGTRAALGFLVVSLATGLGGCLPAWFADVTVRPVDDTLTYVFGGGGNSLVLQHGGETLVVDPKTFLGDLALRRLLAERRARVTHVVDTHAHFDHADGNRFFAGVPIFAAPGAVAALEGGFLASRTPRRGGAATVAVRKRLRLSIGGESVELLHLGGGAHTDGDLAVWLPSRRVLATGDVFDTGFYPRVLAADGGRATGLRLALDLLCGLGAHEVLPGHGPLATGRDVCANAELMGRIETQVRRAREGGKEDAAILQEASVADGEVLSAMFGTFDRKALVAAFLSEIPRN